MNRHVISVAEAANRSWVTSTLRRSLIDCRSTEAVTDNSGVPLPHTMLAACWPRANGDWPGVLGWRTLRWPWNGLRRIVAGLWPSWRTGTRHRWLNRCGRLAWTIFGLGFLLMAVTIAAILTATAAVLYAAANAVGFVAVAAGWSPPMAYETIPPAELDTDRALFTEDDEHCRHQFTSGHPGGSASGSERWDDNSHDPHLAAQQRATRQLARHNDLLEQHQRSRPGSDAAAPVSGSQHDTTALPAAYGYRRPVRRPLAVRLAIWLFVASSIIGCVFYLTAVGLALWSANGGPEPPTNDELITSIHERTEARNQQRAADLAEVLGKQGGTP